MVIFGDPVGVHDSFDSEEAEGLAEFFSFTRRPILTRHPAKTNSLASGGRVNQILQQGYHQLALVLRHSPALALGALLASGRISC